MLIKVNSATHSGLDSIKVEVEINISRQGLPKFEIVGLPAKSVEESQERVRAALSNSGMNFPSRRITVNLAPADIPKEGSFYDLPIAVGIIASSVVKKDIPKSSLFFGELSLDGSLRHTKGALLFALFAKEVGIKNLFLPYDSANEASIVEGVDVYPVNSLEQVAAFLTGEDTIQKAEYKEDEKVDKESFPEFDMSEVVGQSQTKRAMEITAAGGHNVFMIGSPGSGKTMIARALPGIMPPLNYEESLEVTRIYSTTGNIPPRGSLIRKRPFRAPHHNISAVGLIGGGTKPQPGEVTLAHRGALFLDEFNEFPRNALESLRQPMEDGVLTISRSRQRVTYPARFMLVASSNPCPCGFLDHPTRVCKCTPRQVEKYKKRVSGPILDRIDIHVRVPEVDVKKLSGEKKTEEKPKSSAEIQNGVVRARKIQEERFKKDTISVNSEMRNKHIKRHSKLIPRSKAILSKASLKHGLSARSYFKMIKVARTIADLEGEEEIKTDHILEALQFRSQVE